MFGSLSRAQGGPVAVVVLAVSVLIGAIVAGWWAVAVILLVGVSAYAVDRALAAASLAKSLGDRDQDVTRLTSSVSNHESELERLESENAEFRRRLSMPLTPQQSLAPLVEVSRATLLALRHRQFVVGGLTDWAVIAVALDTTGAVTVVDCRARSDVDPALRGEPCAIVGTRGETLAEGILTGVAGRDLILEVPLASFPTELVAELTQLGTCDVTGLAARLTGLLVLPYALVPTPELQLVHDRLSIAIESLVTLAAVSTPSGRAESDQYRGKDEHD